MSIRIAAAVASIIVMGGTACAQGEGVPQLGAFETECLPGVSCVLVLSAHAGHIHPSLTLEVVDERNEPPRVLCHLEAETRPGRGTTASGAVEVEGIVATVGGIKHVVSSLGDRDVLVSSAGYPCAWDGRPVPTVGIYTGQATD